MDGSQPTRGSNQYPPAQKAVLRDTLTFCALVVGAAIAPHAPDAKIGDVEISWETLSNDSRALADLSKAQGIAVYSQ